MTRIIQSLDEIDTGYNAVFCDLWGCLHDGTRAFPNAVAALKRFRKKGGAVVLLTNSPRPRGSVAAQVGDLGAPKTCYDLIVTSGDAAQSALATGTFGRKVHHIGPERDLGFFLAPNGQPYDIELVPLDQAEGIVCTGLFDDQTETPDEYRDTILYGKTRGLKLLCANPDVIVDVGEKRIYCAGAIAKAYAEAGGTSYYFGKPYSPIYSLARDALTTELGLPLDAQDILCLGDGIATDIRGAMGEGLDAAFISGGLAAEETATSRASGPDPAKLKAYLDHARLAPKYAMAYLE
jgi:HAD superfamily hydrolase (TIGR01459 family)